MNPGLLDIPIEIFTAVIVRDEYGGETKTWESYLTCRAREITDKGRERVDANKDTAIGFTAFRVRYYPGITTEMYVECNSEQYNITSINKIGRNNYLDLYTQKRL
jgi:SPP1 family predicted phage head-tail adaptor